MSSAPAGDVVLSNKHLVARFASSAGFMLVALAETKTPRTNVINAYDRGRGVQQSVYGDPDGSLWNTHPWMENWVQGGSWLGKSPVVVRKQVTPSSLLAVTRGIHWATGEAGPVLFTQRAVLQGPVLTVTYAMDYQGDTNQARDQEYPAVFANPQYDEFWRIDGRVDIPELNAQGGSYGALPNGFAAWVNGRLYGLGIRSSAAERFTAYRVKGPAGCSYVAPIRAVSLTPGQSSYTVKLTVGSMPALRSRLGI